MSNKTKHLVVVSGGLSEESSTHRLAAALSTAVVTASKERGLDFVVERINIRDLAQEIASASITGFAGKNLAAAYEAVGGADALIAVSPTYKASYTGLFKAFWDATPDGFISGVPVVLGATGGTPRHALVTETALRPLFAYMKALIAPTGIYAAAEDWGQSSLNARISEAANELVAAVTGSLGDTVASESDSKVRTLAKTRARANDPFVNVPTMSQMLGGK